MSVMRRRIRVNERRTLRKTSIKIIIIGRRSRAGVRAYYNRFVAANETYCSYAFDMCLRVRAHIFYDSLWPISEHGFINCVTSDHHERNASRTPISFSVMFVRFNMKFQRRRRRVRFFNSKGFAAAVVKTTYVAVRREYR
jgi:hypothetical protein